MRSTTASLVQKSVSSLWTKQRRFHVGTLEAPAQIACLADTRAVVRLGGAEVLEFLQGIVSNDTLQLQPEDARPLYSLLLNPQGRLLHDFFLFRGKGMQPTVLADIQKGQHEDLIRLLKRYRLRRQVDFDDVSDQYVPWVKFGIDQLLDSNWSTDPRLVNLGKRIILSRSDKPDDAMAHVTFATPQNYQRWRYVYGVAEGDELPQGHAVPLEYNMDGLHAINFAKGCYVGQELIARAHYQGAVRKRLMPASIEALDRKLVVKDADIVDQNTSKKVGKVVAVGEDKTSVLAMLRITAALHAITGATTLHVAGSTVAVKPWVPTWWHTDWTHGDT